MVIIAYAKAYDLVDAEALTNGVNVLGKENVILQIASAQLRREVLNGGSRDSPRYPGGPEVKIPVPTTPGSNLALSMTSSVGMIAFALGALLL